MLRLTAIFGLIVGFVAIGYAVLSLSSESPRVSTIDKADIIVEGNELGEIPLEAIVTATFRIKNSSAEPIRFIGGPSGCQPDGCMRTAGTCPQIIPANSTIDIPVDVTVYKLGSFKLTVPIYLDIDGATVERATYLTGIGIPNNMPASLHP